MTNVFKIVNWFRVVNYAHIREYFTETLTQMKVMKLLYYVQGVYLAVYNKKAFPNNIVAWHYGPAIPEVHNKYKHDREIINSSNLRITHQDRKDYNDIEKNRYLLPILQEVDKVYGTMSAYGLMKQTHHEAPWNDTPQSKAISNNLLKKYFQENIVE